LFVLAPILFPALALWLDRGASRPRVATGTAVAGALLLVAYLPTARFVSAATIPDALTLVPFHRLHVHAPGLSLRLVVLVVVGIAAAAFALLPRRLAWLLPVALLVVFAGASVNVSRVVAAEASLVQPGTEEHTSELQSPCNLVCRLLLEKKKTNKNNSDPDPRWNSHYTLSTTNP